MIIVHHLEQSRSSRILWLLEELGEDYEVKIYRRDLETRMAEPAFKALSALGKSPLIEIDGQKMAESGAIVEFLAETRAGGGLSVAPGAPARWDYLYWLHFVEGSAMQPVVLNYILSGLGEAGAARKMQTEAEKHLFASFVDAAYRGKEFLIDGRFTAADIQVGYIGDMLTSGSAADAYPDLKRAARAFKARPAHQRATARGAG